MRILGYLDRRVCLVGKQLLSSEIVGGMRKYVIRSQQYKSEVCIVNL